MLVAIAVIFIPMLLDDSEINDPAIDETNIPQRPDSGFSSRIIPLDVENLDAPLTSDSIAVTPSAEKHDGVLVQNADDAAGPRVGVTAWVIQLASFASSANASSLETRLKSSGYSAFVEKVLGEEGYVYRVRVGPELLRADAEALRDKLDAEVKLQGMVVRYP